MTGKLLEVMKMCSEFCFSSLSPSILIHKLTVLKALIKSWTAILKFNLTWGSNITLHLFQENALALHIAHFMCDGLATHSLNAGIKI